MKYTLHPTRNNLITNFWWSKTRKLLVFMLATFSERMKYVRDPSDKIPSIRIAFTFDPLVRIFNFSL